MTTARMPGRGRPARHCYIADSHAMQDAEALARMQKIDDEHNLPAFVWWLIVCIVGVGGFVGGVLLGSAPQ